MSMMSPLEHVIRQYTPQDRESVLRLCADTAFLGDPITPVFSDRLLFARMVMGYYLDNEPEHTLVAEVNDEVIGYRSMAIKRSAHLVIAAKGFFNVARIVKKSLRGEYTDSPQNDRFLRWMFTRSRKEMVRRPSDAVHAHVNLAPQYRGRGIGLDLRRKSFEMLRREYPGIDRQWYYATVFVSSPKVFDFFRTHGYEVYDQRRTTMFEHDGQYKPEVYHVCFVKPLGSCINDKY